MENDDAICICGTGPAASAKPGEVTGEPPIANPKGEDRCPKCGAAVGSGYGLAFGGCGVYYYCEGDNCDWFYKVQDSEGE